MKVSELTKQPEADPELVMDGFRLARTGRYLKTKALRAALAELHPEVPESAIDLAMAKLGEIARRMV